MKKAQPIRIRRNRRWGTRKNCAYVNFPMSAEYKQLLDQITTAGHCGIGCVIEQLLQKISEREPDPKEIAAWLNS